MLNPPLHRAASFDPACGFSWSIRIFRGNLHVARLLAADPAHDVTSLSAPNANQIVDVRKVEYQPVQVSSPTTFREAVEFETATIRARSVVNTAERLTAVGYVPDIVFGHNG